MQPGYVSPLIEPLELVQVTELDQNRADVHFSLL